MVSQTSPQSRSLLREQEADVAKTAEVPSVAKAKRRNRKNKKHVPNQKTVIQSPRQVVTLQEFMPKGRDVERSEGTSEHEEFWEPSIKRVSVNVIQLTERRAHNNVREALEAYQRHEAASMFSIV